MVQDNFKRKAFLRDVTGLERSLSSVNAAGPGRSVLNTNGQSLGQSELVDLLRRAMAGEAYPVSGGRDTASSEDTAAPLTSRIREILQGEPAPELPHPEQHIVEPERLVHPEPIAQRVMQPEAPLAAPAPRPNATVRTSAPVSLRPSLRAVGFIMFAALAGGSVTALTASSPQYVAEASLKLVGEARTTPGLLDATASRLASAHILSQAVARLKLESDPEFNGGGGTAVGIAMDLFSDNGGASDNFSRAQAALRERLTIVPDQRTGIVRLSVTTLDLPQSVRIANLLAQIVVSDAALSPAAAGAPEASDTSRKAYDEASAALADFKAKTGDDKIDAAIALQQQKQTLNSDVDKATAAAQAATIRLAAAKAVRLGDVLNGAISPDLGSPAGLEDLRNRYAAAKSTLAMLATQLGPRHPRLLAQQATVDSLSSGIMTEIQKLVGESDTAVKQANEQVKQLKNRATALDRAAVDVDMAQLEKLQAAVESARASYENDLSAPVAASSVSEPPPLALVAPAIAAPAPSNGSLLVQEICGFLAGLALALCLVIGRMLIRHVWRNWALGEDLQTNLPATAPQHPRAPASELPRQASPPPQMRFDAEMPVANDRPVAEAVSEVTMPVQRPLDRGVLEARQNVASLRARLESYAAQRPVRR